MVLLSIKTGQGASGNRAASPGNSLVCGHEHPWDSTKVKLKVKYVVLRVVRVG